MGGTHSNLSFPQSKHYLLLNYGYCKVWKRKDTHKQTMEQYDISIQSEQHLNKYKQMWQLRTQEENVVGMYYFTHKGSEEFCGVYQKGSILTERILYRLSQFANIPYEESLNILKISLQSYKILFNQYGLFTIRSTMIGINHQNQVKVWFHTDLSQPDPQNGNCSSLLHMINSIIHAVQLNADMPYDYVRFSEFVKANQCKINPNFDQILTVLAKYKEMNNIQQCQGLPRLEQYLRRAEGWEEMSYNSNFLSNMAQFNKQSLPKQNFYKDFSQDSIHSSSLTVKNKPSRNIYTDKEVNQFFKRQKNQRNRLYSRQKYPGSIQQVYVVNYSPRKHQTINFNVSNVHQHCQRQFNLGRFTSKSPCQKAKIEFKIVPPPRNVSPNQVSLGSLRVSTSSIERRISHQPTHTSPQVQAIYTMNPPQAVLLERRNRFQGASNQSNNSKSNSFSRQSSINNFIEPIKFQY